MKAELDTDTGTVHLLITMDEWLLLPHWAV
jgi:hypothetical protein